MDRLGESDTDRREDGIALQKIRKYTGIVMSARATIPPGAHAGASADPGGCRSDEVKSRRLPIINCGMLLKGEESLPIKGRCVTEDLL